MVDESIGFYLGVSPGVVVALLNFRRIIKTVGQAQALARANGEYLDFHFNENAKRNLYLHPERFIEAKDGPGVRAGKELLLRERYSFLAGHLRAFLIVCLGGIAGSLIVAFTMTPH